MKILLDKAILVTAKVRSFVFFTLCPWKSKYTSYVGLPVISDKDRCSGVEISTAGHRRAVSSLQDARTVNGKFQFTTTTRALTSVIQQFHLTAKIVHVVTETVHYISSNVHNVI